MRRDERIEADRVRARPAPPRAASADRGARRSAARARATPATDHEHVWICLTPATAAAIARIAARRSGSIVALHEHPAHEAAHGPTSVGVEIAAQWRRDAWQAADEGLIAVTDALLLAAQIDPPGAA